MQISALGPRVACCICLRDGIEKDNNKPVHEKKNWFEQDKKYCASESKNSKFLKVKLWPIAYMKTTALRKPGLLPVSVPNFNSH